MKKSTLINQIADYLDEHCDPTFLDVTTDKMAEQILHIVLSSNMKPPITKYCSVLLTQTHEWEHE